MVTSFDHDRTPERIVHERATGVHGFFLINAGSRLRIQWNSNLVQQLQLTAQEKQDLTAS